MRAGLEKICIDNVVRSGHTLLSFYTSAPGREGLLLTKIETGTETTGEAVLKQSRGDRMNLVLAIMLATLGLLGALIAWRVGDASDIAADATLEGLIVTRQLAAAEAGAAGLVARTNDAWLEYESSRLSAISLREAGFADLGLEAAMRGAAHWFLVRPEYLDEVGNYDPQLHREAYLAEAASRSDLDPAPHFALADIEQQRMRNLLLAGIVLAIALPLLTIAEVTKRRKRLVCTLTASVFIVAGVGVMIWAWL